MEQLDFLTNQEIEKWNAWRNENANERLDLKELDGYLNSIDLSGANLSQCNLQGVDFSGTNLNYSNLNGSLLHRSYLSGCSLYNSTLIKANLREAYIRGANFECANLSGADLELSTMVKVNFKNADFTGCKVYGTSIWDLSLEGAIMKNIIITPTRERMSEITVDNLEVAQFIYLILNNKKIRSVLDTLTSKAVLILGRFTSERKKILDGLKDCLREKNYLPILFDFEKPSSRDLTETISILAHMSKFIIADLTDAKSIPQELQAIVPDLPSVPVQPILLKTGAKYALFEHFKRYPWVMDIYYYNDGADLNFEFLTKIESNINNN